MILTDDMLAVAFQYRDTELWNILTDSDVFAFRLSDGETGYCCVMGNGGEHLALGFYRGQKGFASYLKSLGFGSMRLSEVDMLEMAATFDCINCDFIQASAVQNKTKKIIRDYVNAHGLKVRRPKGWPDFTRHLPFKVPLGITCEKDAADIVEALRAAIAVAGELACRSLTELGFDEKGDYPTMEGGKPVPYLVPNAEGTYDWGMIELPALLPDEWPAPEFTNDILIRRVKKLRTSGTLQMKLIHMPAPVDESADGIPFLPSVVLCLDAGEDGLFPVFCMEDGEEAPRQMLVELVDNLCRLDNKPDMIEVEDGRTESLLKDFCDRCGIRLSRKEELSELEDACSFLIANFMQ